MIKSYSSQFIDSNDINSVISVLKSDFLTQGPVNLLFEKEISEYTGSRYCLTTNSATSALHLAYLALGINKGDIVWTTTITFVATVNAAKMCGADVELVDINYLTYNLDLNQLEIALCKAKKNKRLPKVITVVHMCGSPVDMVRLNDLSKIYFFKIIEDASHAFGAKYPSEDVKVGNGKYSDITVFSFHPVKMITTGEGGAVVTNSRELYSSMKIKRSHGIIRDNLEEYSDLPENCFYDQTTLGYNYRMSEINAALGLSQIKKIDRFLTKRKSLASIYTATINNDKYKIQKCDLTESSLHLFVITTNYHSNSMVIKKLRMANIPAHFHYIPIYKHSYHKDIKIHGCINSELYFKHALSLPLSYQMTEKDVLQITSLLNEI